MKLTKGFAVAATLTLAALPQAPISAKSPTQTDTERQETQQAGIGLHETYATHVIISMAYIYRDYETRDIRFFDFFEEHRLGDTSLFQAVETRSVRNARAMAQDTYGNEWIRYNAICSDRYDAERARVIFRFFENEGIELSSLEARTLIATFNVEQNPDAMPAQLYLTLSQAARETRSKGLTNAPASC